MADDTLDKSGRQGDALDALIVGAGPTGLTLAAQLRAFGVRFRIIDRLLDRSRESRALAVQARTLEIFDSLGLAERLIGRGRTSTRLMIHFEDRVAAAQLGVFGARDTRFPFILFVSQAETEALLRDHLAGQNVVMESGVTLTAFLADAEVVHCTLGHSDGRYEEVTTRYLIGCDGAHSTVRSGAGIPFEGGDYPEDFVLGDVEADGPIERDVLHAFAGKRAFAFFFPLGAPATWRTIALPPRDWRAADDAPVTSALSLGELQVIIDGATGGALRLHDAAWLTHFRLHHRQTAHYRSGRIFLAGDAAHIHSPVGGQGMNTGIQDAWNLGWKLALVTRGQAVARLLDSYEAERWPVGHILLRTTDRAFSLFTRVMASSAKASWFRREVASRVLPIVLSSRRLRALGFRFVSELGIRYRDSPAVAEGTPRRRNGPRAGDRLPDATVARAGLATSLHRELAGPKLHLLLCGEPDMWDNVGVDILRTRYGDLLAIHHLTRGSDEGALADSRGEAFARLGVRDVAQFFVRPDGHIGFRSGGADLEELTSYLARWFPARGAAATGGAPAA